MKLKFSYFRLTLGLIASLALSQFAQASSVIPLSTSDQVAAAGAIFRGVVVGTDCYRDATDGLIYTRTSLRVIESFKGTLPTIVAVVHPGGTVGEVTSYNSWSPRMNHGDVRLMFVTRRPDARLTSTQGAASALKLAAQNEPAAATQEALLAEIRSLTGNSQSPGDDYSDQTGFVTSALTTGLTDRGGGIPARFIQADAGEPIPYLIDADHLPAGITLAQATNAVAQAMNAWSAVTSLKFKSEGVQSFGTNANAINPNNGKLYIQLHDDYNTINSASTLGIGGAYTSSALIGGTWGAGGNVAGNEFFRSSSANVVLERTNATMQNLATFTEVLCHEIGHAIGMAHSSETLSEPNNTLKQSIMYYLVHADGRGAALGTYDPPVIQQAYPTNNTPPYTYSRMMNITTSSTGAPNVPGINELEVRGYDLQGTTLTLQTNGAASVGTGAFSRSGSTIKFTPNSNWDTTPLDPTSGSYYERIYARFSDGTNASAAAEIRVISHSIDSVPTVRDGIPNVWMTTYFGVNNTNSNRSAQSDFDGDGMTNMDEYRSGMNPTNATSAQRITLFTKESLQFQAKAYELYELQASSNLTSWFRAANPIIPTTSTGTFSNFTNTAPHLFFRVQKVP